MSVKPETIEQRLEALEVEVAFLKSQLNFATPTAKPWWEKITGKFANNPAYDEAMKLGQDYRKSQRLSHWEESEDI